jgi:DNA-binding LytR/AlgR family response regulator
MKIFIADDEAIIAESLFQVLYQLGYEPIEPASSAREALETLQLHTPDLGILDIHLGEPFSGFTIADYFFKNNIPFLFLTALYDTATVQRAKFYNPTAYLVKPFTKENLFATIELARVHVTHQTVVAEPAPFFLKLGNKHLSLDPLSITHLKSEGKYVNIHNNNGKKHLVRATLSEVTEQLQQVSFIQTHKSYYVNPIHIKLIKYDELVVNDTIIPIGRAYRESLKKNLTYLKVN